MRIDSISDDTTFDDVKKIITDNKTKEVYKIGQKVTVKLIAASKMEKAIDFILIKDESIS